MGVDPGMHSVQLMGSSTGPIPLSRVTGLASGSPSAENSCSVAIVSMRSSAVRPIRDSFTLCADDPKPSSSRLTARSSTPRRGARPARVIYSSIVRPLLRRASTTINTITTRAATTPRTIHVVADELPLLSVAAFGLRLT